MNRRMRNRMSGGVGGRQGRPCLLPDTSASFLRRAPKMAILSMCWCSAMRQPFPAAKSIAGS